MAFLQTIVFCMGSFSAGSGGLARLGWMWHVRHQRLARLVSSFID